MAKIIEFTGTPESGKTTVIYEIFKKLEKQRIKIIDEAWAKTKKELKNDAENRSIHTMATIMKEYFEAINKNYDYILIDRGLYDRYFWNYYSYENGDITLEEKNIRDSFALHQAIEYKVDLLFVFSVSSEEAIKRRGREGSFSTKARLDLYEEKMHKFFSNFNKTKVFKIETTGKSVEQVVSEVVEKICYNSSIGG